MHPLSSKQHLSIPPWSLAGSLDPSTGIFYRTPENPRLRTAQACEKCRTRKAKCSGEHPTCNRCLTRGLICEYAKEGRMRGPHRHKMIRESASTIADDSTSSSVANGPTAAGHPHNHHHQHQHHQHKRIASAPQQRSSTHHPSELSDLDPDSEIGKRRSLPLFFPSPTGTHSGTRSWRPPSLILEKNHHLVPVPMPVSRQPPQAVKLIPGLNTTIKFHQDEPVTQAPFHTFPELEQARAIAAPDPEPPVYQIPTLTEPEPSFYYPFAGAFGGPSMNGYGNFMPPYGGRAVPSNAQRYDLSPTNSSVSHASSFYGTGEREEEGRVMYPISPENGEYIGSEGGMGGSCSEWGNMIVGGDDEERLLGYLRM